MRLWAAHFLEDLESAARDRLFLQIQESADGMNS
jgi:hypothetical protein